MLLAAIGAGQSSRLRPNLLLAEVVLLALGLAASVALGLVVAHVSGWQLMHRDGRVGFVALLTFAIALVLASGLTYIEYLAVGRRRRFRSDLRRSVWVGRRDAGRLMPEANPAAADFDETP
jgi:hypothetical protein